MESVEKKEPTRAQYEEMQGGDRVILNQIVLEDGTLIYQYSIREGGDDEWGYSINTVAIDTDGKLLKWNKEWDKHIVGWDKDGYTPDKK